MTIQNNYDRITFSLPHDINIALNNLKNEIKTSKSDIIKLAIEHYLQLQEKLKLQKAIELMSDEYQNNSTLTEFTILDSEVFL
jgi:predicted DNA-binding protein